MHDTVAFAVREGGKRLLPDGQKKKEPLELRHMERICQEHAGPGCSLADLMVCTAISLGFFGFFRYNDSAALHVAWVRIFSHHAELFLTDRKTDQFREGSWIAVSA